MTPEGEQHSRRRISNPLVSIITVTKNNAEGLRRTLHSIKQQTYVNYEVIVVDGHSRDHTPEIVKKQDAVVDIFIQESTPGVYGAMNDGIGLARGVWVIFLNAGDEFAHGAVLEKMSLECDADMLFGTARRRSTSECINPWFEGKSFLRGMPVCHQAIFFRRELLLDNCYDTRFTVAADYELLMRLRSAGAKMEFRSVCVAAYEGGGLSNRLRYRRMFENARIVLKYDANRNSVSYFLAKTLRFAWWDTKKSVKALLGMRT